MPTYNDYDELYAGLMANMPAAVAALLQGVDGDTLESLSDQIDLIDPVIGISAAQAGEVSSGSLAIKSYNTLSQAITSTLTDDFDTLTKLWLAIKSNLDDADAESLIFIEETDGLTILDGAAYATPAHGTLTVSGVSGAWVVTVWMDEVATGLLHDLNGTYYVELKALSSGDTLPIWEGNAIIIKGVIMAVA